MTLETTARVHTPLVGLLDQARKLIADELQRRLAEAGHADIRDSHGCVFGHIAADGSRLTDLASSAQLTKQAVGEAVSDLERHGYVDRVPDPADGRAKIIRLTEEGQRVQAFGDEVLDAVEEAWAQRYGRERMETVRALLEDVLAGEMPAA